MLSRSIRLPFRAGRFDTCRTTLIRDKQAVEDEISFLRRAKKRGNLTHSHRRAPKQEKEIAKRVGGRLTAGSGSKDVKGDVRIKGLARIECKTTKNKSFSVTLGMIEKIEEAAALTGELPFIVVEFNDNAGNKIKDVVVCPAYVLDTLRG